MPRKFMRLTIDIRQRKALLSIVCPCNASRENMRSINREIRQPGLGKIELNHITRGVTDGTQRSRDC